MRSTYDRSTRVFACDLTACCVLWDNVPPACYLRRNPGRVIRSCITLNGVYSEITIG